MKDLARTAEAVQGIVKAVPVYKDALQPAAKEFGKSLETVAKAVNVVLAPVSALVWGYDEIRDFIHTRVAGKLRTVPIERLKTPNPTVAGPALEALRYAGHEESLSELYANLLATSIDSATAEHAHPGFVEIIRNLSPDEARIIGSFSKKPIAPLITLRLEATDGTVKGGFDAATNLSMIGSDANADHPALTPSYLDNLWRLGLIDIPRGMHLTQEGVYDRLENDPEILARAAELRRTNPGREVRMKRGVVEVTNLGKQFISACVVGKPN